jgi:hypothetical protein
VLWCGSQQRRQFKVNTTSETGTSAERSGSADRVEVRPYDTARSEIRDGDVLLWGGRSGVSRFTRFMSGGFYSHAAIVAWWGHRLMVLEAAWYGLRAVPMSRTVREYNGTVDWYPIRDEEREGDRVSRLLDVARKELGLPFSVPKAFLGLCRRLLGLVPRRGGNRQRPGAMFCSEYVARCFRLAGMRLQATEDPDTLPVDIADSKRVRFGARIHGGTP